MTAVYSLPADAGVTEFSRRGAVVDAANPITEECMGRVLRWKVSWEATARACRARLLFPLAHQRGLAQDERALERSAAMSRVRAEVRDHRESFVGLAEADFVRKHDPALPLD